MVPDAPVTFSMMTAWPSGVRMASLRLRARVSTGPPAPNGTIRVTGCDGYGCPTAARTNARMAMAKPRESFLTVGPQLMAKARQDDNNGVLGRKPRIEGRDAQRRQRSAEIGGYPPSATTRR